MITTASFALFWAASASALTPAPSHLPPRLPAYTPAPSHYYHRRHPQSVVGVTPAPRYYGHPGGAVTPGYGAAPHLASASTTYKADRGAPACAKRNGTTWCLEDPEYPTYDVQHAIEYHYSAVAAMYKDVVANTGNSVDGSAGLAHPAGETYLCPSSTSYATLQRALNTDGRWRFVVNGVKAHYESLSQTVRIEECEKASAGKEESGCPLVPPCYRSACVQASTYHRFLVYDPREYHFPFSVESFRLPSSCQCHAGEYKTEKH